MKMIQELLIWPEDADDEDEDLTECVGIKKNNLNGNIAKYEHKVCKADCRLCKAIEAEKDTNGLVRMVMRHRDAREQWLPYKSKIVKNLKLAVQSLVLICSAVEANKALGKK